MFYLIQLVSSSSDILFAHERPKIDRDVACKEAARKAVFSLDIAPTNESTAYAFSVSCGPRWGDVVVLGANIHPKEFRLRYSVVMEASCRSNSGAKPLQV